MAINYRIFLISIFLLLYSGVWFQFLPNKPNSLFPQSISAQLSPIDTKYSDQKSALSSIQLESAWDITTGSNEIIVAVIDDAVDINHPDLRDNMMAGYDFVEGDDDPSPGLCFDPISQTETLEQHGTQVAGIIGAVGNNNLGIAGINWQIKIMPLRIGCYYQSNLETQAVQYAIDHGAHIINASYGGPELLARNKDVIQLLENAAQKVLLVTAAGNYHVNNDELPVYPGNVGLPNVLTVAASDRNNQLTEWAQYGASSVDLTAPGIDLQTTIAGSNNLGDYDEVNGSSFSTAVASGVAALVKSYDFNQNLSPSDLKAVLQASVSPIAGQNARNKTSGLINARAALDLIDSPQPVVSIVDVNYVDNGEIIVNGLIDEHESGNINVDIENLWADILTGTISVSVDNPAVHLPITFFNITSMLANERREFSFPIQTNAFSGHQRIRFHLDIKAIGVSKDMSYKRSFEIQTGVLPSNTQLNARIQQNIYDDYQYYHLNIPQNMDRVAIELEYEPSDSRDMGLLAAFDKRPLIHFRGFNGAPYWYSATYRSDDKTGFERIDLRATALTSSTLKVLVFNAPASNPSVNFEDNKSYKLKGCFFSDSDGNSPPIVNAGTDRNVNAGDSIVLKGEVSDIDDKITRAYWLSNNGIDFVVLNDNQIQFTAPNSGEYTFSFVAIDDGCKKTVDNVTVYVSDLSGNEPDGLLLNPRTLNIDENSGFDVLVSAFYNSKEVTDLSMLTAPAGVEFTDGKISWQNAGPVGTYLIKFSANVDIQVLLGTITVNIQQRRIGNGGGGCVALKNSEFDPLFLIYILLSYFFIQNKSFLRTKKQNSL